MTLSLTRADSPRYSHPLAFSPSLSLHRSRSQLLLQASAACLSQPRDARRTKVPLCRVSFELYDPKLTSRHTPDRVRPPRSASERAARRARSNAECPAGDQAVRTRGRKFSSSYHIVTPTRPTFASHSPWPWQYPLPRPLALRSPPSTSVCGHQGLTLSGNTRPSGGTRYALGASADKQALRHAQKQERGARIATELLNMASRFEAGVGRDELRQCIARLQELAEVSPAVVPVAPRQISGAEAGRAVASRA